MASAILLLVLVVALALAFDYINGFHDTANAVATVVSTNVLPGRTAVLMAAVLNFVGAFAGVGVAKTIGGDITDPTKITQTVVASALIGSILWNLLTWYYGIPSSSSHALIGGLVGAIWCHEVIADSSAAGMAMWELLSSKGLVLILRALVLSPLFGLMGGFLLMLTLFWLVRRMRPSTVNRTFRALQLASAGFMAFAHGSNDAQKSMGIITMALVVFLTLPATERKPGVYEGTIVAMSEDEVTLRYGSGEAEQTKTIRLAEDAIFTRKAIGGNWHSKRETIENALAGAKGKLSGSTIETEGEGESAVAKRISIPTLDVPWWVIISCATAMGLGTASGGWRIMKTMGHKIIRLRPINGFAAETAAAAVILLASYLKAPVSTTHVIASSIMGVGASTRVSAVRWGVAGNILIAWVLTIPISAVVSALTYWVLRLLVGE